jgi:hypothetical protein
MDLAKRFDNIDRMRQGTAQRFPVNMRGYNGTFRPLSIYETNVVASETIAEMASKPKSQQNDLMENSILSMKILEKATTSDVNKTDPQLTFMELQQLSPKEIEFLYGEYVAACEKLDPKLEKMDPKEVQVLVEEAKKKEAGLGSALMTYSFSQVWNIALYLLTRDEQPPAK